MKQDFATIRQALEEHLQAINENSSEIQALLDYLQEVELKVDKLAQRLDTLQLTHNCEKPIITPLNDEERKVFVVLYTEEMALSYTELAKKAQLSLSLVPEYVSSLVQKGIPLLRSYSGNQLFFKLDPQFKEVQAKENVVNLSLQSFMK